MSTSSPAGRRDVCIAASPNTTHATNTRSRFFPKHVNTRNTLRKHALTHRSYVESHHSARRHSTRMHLPLLRGSSLNSFTQVSIEHGTRNKIDAAAFETLFSGLSQEAFIAFHCIPWIHSLDSLVR